MTDRLASTTEHTTQTQARVDSTVTMTVLTLTGCPEIPFPVALHQPTRVNLEQRTTATRTITTITVASWSAATVLTFSDDRAALRERRAQAFDDLPPFLHQLIFETVGVDTSNLDRATL